MVIALSTLGAGVTVVVELVVAGGVVLGAVPVVVVFFSHPAPNANTRAVTAITVRRWFCGDVIFVSPIESLLRREEAAIRLMTGSRNHWLSNQYATRSARPPRGGICIASPIDAKDQVKIT
ncbi:MAG: hypothetical protein H0X11_10330 [Betaproteobacteria bacterium]|nr:hypothetical protein [Betaproteobacteria bacterium]